MGVWEILGSLVEEHNHKQHVKNTGEPEEEKMLYGLGAWDSLGWQSSGQYSLEESVEFPLSHAGNSICGEGNYRCKSKEIGKFWISLENHIILAFSDL